MLSELHIENLAVIDGARMLFSPGLNVITGETGAGKTILAHAISLLLGVRADSALIRPGASEATVEAVFSLPDGCFADLEGEIDIPEGEELAVRRRISRDGRSRAFVGGRTVTLAVLSELTGRLLAFSAQHEQRRMMMASRQLDILDDFAGSGLAALLDEYSILYSRRTQLQSRLSDLDHDFEARRREAELLKFQLAEIEAAELAPGEDTDLASERDRLGHARELREASGALATALAGGDPGESEGLIDSLSLALSRLENVSGADGDLDIITGRLQKIFYELEEIGRSAREYSEGVQDDPARLAEIEQRLDLIGQLKRKYGEAGEAAAADANAADTSADGTSPSAVAAILAYAHKEAGRLEKLAGNLEGKPALEARLAETEQEMIVLATSMSALRREAAARLQEEAGEHLRDLAFNDCGFEVRLSTAGSETGEREINPESLHSTGADSAEFLVQLNPGMPATPLRETASGGELSRIMLAIKSAVSTSRDTATLVFDEIDAGIGGKTGAAVGAKLRSLSADTQLICITHLPQIASCAETSFRVLKLSEAGKTTTSVERLEGGARVDELCRMMGSNPEDKKARAHAASLLEE
ncbi:MAG: DNA repair protein RecN [Thermoleophilia bacterium]